MLRDKISEALKEAMRSKNTAALTTIRMINAGIKQKDIDVARARGDQTITDEEILSLLQSLIKSRRESIEMFKQGGRQDLIEKESAEITVIEQFLPRQLNAEETQAVVKAAIASASATSIKDMGKVMAVLKSQYAGELDMSKAGPIVKELLAS